METTYTGAKNSAVTPSNEITGRFLLTFKKYIIENQKMFLYGTLAFLGFWIMIGAWCGWFQIGGNEGSYVFYLFASSIVLTVLASLMFKDMVGKEKRIYTLMAPASAADKFWVRFIMNILVPVALCVFGYFIFEWSRMLFEWVRYSEVTPLFLPSKKHIAMATDEAACLTALFVSGCLFNTALYCVGSICWPRLSFLKTMALQFGIQMLLMTLMSIIATVNFDLPFSIILSEQDIYAFLWTLAGIITAFSAAGFWFTYYKFKTKSLI